MGKKNDGKRKHPILAPLQVLKREPLHIIWVVFVLFFGLINIWHNLVLWHLDSVVSTLQGDVIYVFSISICAPFLAEVLIRLVVNKRSHKETSFLTYRVASCALNFLWIIILTFLWLGDLKAKLWLPITVGIISILFAFYMYCISQMELDVPLLRKYNDSLYDEYLREEKMNMGKTEEDARQLITITGNKGDIEI